MAREDIFKQILIISQIRLPGLYHGTGDNSANLATSKQTLKLCGGEL